MPDAQDAALLSLSDTRGAAELARALSHAGARLIATSGTRAFLAGHGVEALDVESMTGFAPLFGGLVKTLHPNVFGAILHDRASPDHRAEAVARGIGTVSTVAVTLYPPPEIDIGGVALLRAAAKNYASVSVLSDPAQYGAFIDGLRRGGPTLDERRALAVAAFERTAAYDLENAARLNGSSSARLRYGENPHERATFQSSMNASLEQFHGKALSYNNILDLDAALRVLVPAPLTRADAARFVRAVIVKHTVPCGVADRGDASAAVREALDADRTSAYGGIAAIDARVTGDAADALATVFLEIVAAPEFDDDALARLRRRRNLRVMRFPFAFPAELAARRRIRSALGGTLVQEPDPSAAPEELSVASQRAPSAGEWRDLLFAWDVVRHVSSNGIVVVNDLVTRGICAGQTNRVSAVEIATKRAGSRARGAACASDGFFPFADGLEAAVAAGCSAVIAPGGSVRDGEVTAAADAAGVALVFSNRRYFLH